VIVSGPILQGGEPPATTSVDQKDENIIIAAAAPPVDKPAAGASVAAQADAASSSTDGTDNVSVALKDAAAQVRMLAARFICVSILHGGAINVSTSNLQAPNAAAAAKPKLGQLAVKSAKAAAAELLAGTASPAPQHSPAPVPAAAAAASGAGSPAALQTASDAAAATKPELIKKKAVLQAAALQQPSSGAGADGAHAGVAYHAFLSYILCVFIFADIAAAAADASAAAATKPKPKPRVKKAMEPAAGPVEAPLAGKIPILWLV
jgi:hypothetical protein